MNEIKKRPFAFSCCIFIFFSYIFYLCPHSIKAGAAVVALATGAALLFFGANARRISFYLVLPVLISSAVSLLYFNIYYNKVTSYAFKSSDITFVVLDDNYTSESFSTYTVKIETIDGERTNVKSTLSVSCDLDAEAFSVHSCRARLELLSDAQYGFSPKNYGLSQGIFLSAEAEGDVVSHYQTRKSFPSYHLRMTSKYFSSVIDKYIPSDKSAFSKALILGDTSVLGPKDNLNFRLLGLSHALAVSGTHLTILIGSFDSLLEKLRLCKKKRCVIVILLTLFYAGLTGFSPAVKRSAIMFIITSLSFLIARRNDALTSLCFSGAFLCLLEPNALFDVGLQLSFLSTMGIIVVAIPATYTLERLAFKSRSKKKKRLYKLWSALLFGIAPITFSLPVIWLSFGEFALLSPLTNIVLSPLFTIVMYSCPIMLILSFIPPLAYVVSFIPAYSSVLLLKLAELLSRNAPVVSINYGFSLYIIILLVFSLVVLLLKNPKNKFVYLAPLGATVIAFAICISVYTAVNYGNTKAVYTSNSDGDAFLITTQGKAILCDISGCSYRSAKECEYYLGENHLTRLDTYLVTDLNARGARSLERLACLTRINRLMLPSPANRHESLIADALIQCAQDNDIECVLYDVTESNQIDFADLSIDVKNLARGNTNTPSAVCVTISKGNSSFSYVSLGCYSTESGKRHLTELFNNADSILFGNYGKESKSDERMSLFYKPEIKLFFTSEGLYNSYRKNLSEDAAFCITGNYYEFELG